jgi:tetratricopeptide (TPR) repeat protein
VLLIAYELRPHETRTVVRPTALQQLIESTPVPHPDPTATPALVSQLPATKVLTNGTQMFQTFNNCGPASLAMTLSHYGITVSQQELGAALRPFQHPRGDNDDKSVTLDELANKASEYGFTVYHRPVGNIQLIKQFISSDIPVITRTWLKEGDDIGHYRVITGYDETAQEIIQDDSLQGKNLRYSYAAFTSLWKAFNYEYLVLIPEEKKDIAAAILGDHTNETAAWTEAAQAAETAVRADPTDIYAQFNRSVALYHLGDFEGSITAFEAIESKLPRRMLWYQIEPIMAYYQLGKYDRVFALTDSILQNQNRAFSELYYIRGFIYQKQGQTVQAEAEFALARKYNSNLVFSIE